MAKRDDLLRIHYACRGVELLRKAYPHEHAIIRELEACVVAVAATLVKAGAISLTPELEVLLTHAGEKGSSGA